MTQRSGSGSQPGQQAPQQIDVSAFTGAVDSFASTGGRLEVSETKDAIQLSWPGLDSSRVVVYLIAASASGCPDSLHGAQRVAATTGVSATVPLDSGPHFTVFGYEGESVEEAVRSTGRPHAQASLLPEVRDLSITAYSSMVVVQWSRPIGVDRVRIYRSLPDQPLPDHSDPALEITTVDGDVFEDRTATPGARYTYRIHTLEARSELPSAGVTKKDVLVPLTPVAVMDLRAETELHDPDLWVSLRYSQPSAGRVVIMQSVTMPTMVQNTRLLSEEQLATLSLGTPVARMPVPTAEAERLIANVPIQVTKHTSHYFTPVTYGTGEGVVGRSIAVHHVAPVRDAEIIDRIDYQILRFAWPAGAMKVAYQVATLGATVEDPAGWKYCERRNYDEFGGIRLPLPDTGARLFVRGVRGSESVGALGIADYRGRYVLRYRFDPVASGKRVLKVLSESQLSGLYVEIQHHPEHWPTASTQDAEPAVGTTIASLPFNREIRAGELTAVSEELAFEPGYVRAFIVPQDPENRPVMVVDPDPEISSDSRAWPATEAVRNRWGFRTQGGRSTTEPQAAGSIRCMQCLQSFPETRIAVRCPQTGTCPPALDVIRGAYVNTVPEIKPVYSIEPAALADRAIPCPECGAPNSQQVCPLCHGDLPRYWGAQDWFALTFVGAKATGKTITMTVLQRELRQRVVHSIGRTMQPADDLTARRVEEFEDRLYRQHTVAEPTLAASANPYARVPMVFDLGLGRTNTPASLALFDVPGEDMSQVSATEQYAHLLTRSDGLVFLFDPQQIPSVQENLQSYSPDYMDSKPVEADPVTVLRNIVRVIRDARGQLKDKLPVRLCVVVSKLDSLQHTYRHNVPELRELIPPGSVLMRDPYAIDNAPLFLPGDAELEHQEVRGLLERLKATDFLHLLDSNFADFRFFAQSALGHRPIANRTLSDAGITPFRLSNVVRMFLAEKQW
ncbi:MAG: TRAFAC clade GTPase domain-containing protein [Jatrophihabitantaceae bacterium]